MRGLFFKYWDRVRSGFWFLPAAMAGGAVALALVSVAVDEPLTAWLAANLGWTFTGGAEGASAVLGIVAGSMITIAGVVFSMTLVALSLASSQLGPRLLRSFMRDSTTQVVLPCDDRRTPTPLWWVRLTWARADAAVRHATACYACPPGEPGGST